MQRTIAKAVVALTIVVALAASVQAVDLTPNGSLAQDALGAGFSDRGYNSASSEIFADTMLTSLMVQREFRKALPSIHTYSQTAHLQTGGNPCVPGSNWVMWDTPFAMRETHKSKDGYLGYETSTSGFATGISRMLGETTAIGLAVGYDYRKMNGRDDYYLKERGDTFHAAVYGGTAIGCFFFDGYAGYSRTWHRTERDINGTPAGDVRTSANYNSTVLSAGLKASYVWVLPNEYRITSSLGLDYSHVRKSHITDKTDAGTFNAIDKANHNFVQMPLIVSASKTFSAEFLKFGGFCSMWTPEVRVGYVPQFGSRRTSVGTDFGAGGTIVNFQSKSTDIGRNHGLVGAGLKLKLRDKVILGVDYNYQFSKKYDNHSLTATYGVSF